MRQLLLTTHKIRWWSWWDGERGLRRWDDHVAVDDASVENAAQLGDSAEKVGLVTLDGLAGLAWECLMIHDIPLENKNAQRDRRGRIC